MDRYCLGSWLIRLSEGMLALFWFYLAVSGLVCTVIGCSDAFSSGGRNNTCFHVSTDDLAILIDCGAGALAGLKQQGLATTGIHAVIITHFHGDHFAGLPFVIFDMVRGQRKEPLLIFTPPGGQEKLKQALDLFYPGSSVLEKIDISFIEFSGQQEIDHDRFTLRSFPVVHTPESLPHGVRLYINGKVIAYTGDTEWTDTIPEIVADADLAICECTFYKKRTEGHMDHMTLLKHITELRAKRILLTHFDQEMLDMLPEIKYECAYDGQVINIG